MTLPDVVSQDEWRAARTRLLEAEKDLTRRRDALNAERRRLPMVRVEADYRFEGPDGEVTLLDMFEGRRQLIVVHFMFDPEWEQGCSSCTAGADEMSDGLRAPPARPRDDDRVRRARPDREDRGLPARARLDVPLLLVATAARSTTTST